MIAYHYPPCCLSSGLHRTLSFCRHLPNHGWTPLVLTVHPRAYPQVGSDQSDDIPAQVLVERAFALDAARHLAFRGRYLGMTGLPDRWMSWLLGAVPAGLRLIRKYEPRILWSTYPIATAHLIGLILHRLTRIPWVADFRDPMLYESYPTVPMIRRLHGRIERAAVTYSRRSVLTTPMTLEFYAERYPERPASHWVLIANGYDEMDFVGLAPSTLRNSDRQGPVVLVHSGLMDPDERDPTNLFAAVARLKVAGRIGCADLKIVLRGSGNDPAYSTMIHAFGIGDIVSLEPQIPHRWALQEMLDADGLLILQGPQVNRQIPAKLYETFRANRPLFVITDPEGETAKAVQKVHVDAVVRYDSVDEIAEKLWVFVGQIRAGCAPAPSPAIVNQFSRQARAAEFAAVLDSVADAN